MNGVNTYYIYKVPGFVAYFFVLFLASPRKLPIVDIKIRLLSYLHINEEKLKL